MTKLSRLHLDSEKLGHYVNNLWSAVTLLDSKEDIRLLFKDLFTHTEYKMFAKRLEIARRLLEGQTYEEIMNALKVTSRTINTVSNILMTQGGGLRVAHQKLGEMENKYTQKQKAKQDLLERRKRKKLPAETFILDALVEGASQANKFISKRLKQRSARKVLSS